MTHLLSSECQSLFEKYLKSINTDYSILLTSKLKSIVSDFDNSDKANLSEEEVDAFRDEIMNIFIWKKTPQISLGYKLQEDLKMSLQSLLYINYVNFLYISGKNHGV